MKSLTDLRFLFVLVAVVETIYGLAGLFIPPSVVATIPGWNLTPDGQWLAKLMGVALSSQALIAWWCRKSPPVSIAAAFAFYQLGSATVDWLMWLTLKDQGIFPIEAGRWSVIFSIPTHYIIGLLLLVGIARARRAGAGLPDQPRPVGVGGFHGGQALELQRR